MNTDNYPDAVAFATAPAGPTLDGTVCVVAVEDLPLVPVQAIWLPYTRSAVHTYSPRTTLVLVTNGGWITGQTIFANGGYTTR